ncbi:MAG: AAA family ATPase [Myxococcales bacterium]|nr:AAA family ATPase [Polyangiaceae bacterium]MDW8251013.1 AAA family ATPase [Myxococcales bacterium]
MAVAQDPSPALSRLRTVLEGALEGKPEVVELALITLLARGHLLIEDVPGVGKTTLAHALAQAIGCEMRRVQFTSDLLPSDILGVSIFDQRKGEFQLRKGPIFSHVLVADEINRASPRTQSALLEAMNEGQVSLDGQTLPLPDPFFVIATQNPDDFAGTFPLPEVQLDRFMIRLRIGYPPPHVELRLIQDHDWDRGRPIQPILDPATLVSLQRQVQRVVLDHSLAVYLRDVVSATRTCSALSVGASPRAGISLARAARARALLHNRHYCIADDIHLLTPHVLAHRVRLTTQAEGYTPTREEAENTVREVISRVPVPL